MSDVMLFGVLRMPYEMAMGDELSRRQFYDRVQEAADRLEAAERATPPSPSTETLREAVNFIAGHFEHDTMPPEIESLVQRLRRLAPSTASEAGDLPPPPKPECLVVGVYGYCGSHMSDYGKVCYAVGRASAVRDYVTLNEAALAAKTAQPSTGEVDGEAAFEAWFAEHDDANKCCHEAFKDGFIAARSGK